MGPKILSNTNGICIDINDANENCICQKHFRRSDTVRPAQHYTYIRLEEGQKPAMCLEETWASQYTARVVNLVFSCRLTAPGHLEVVDAVKRIWIPVRCYVDDSSPREWVDWFALPTISLRNAGVSDVYLAGGFGEIIISPGERTEIPVKMEDAAYIRDMFDYIGCDDPSATLEEQYGADEMPVSELLGKTVRMLDVVRKDRALRFYCSDGSEFILYHCQDCCEDVRIEDISGDLYSLLNSPIRMAEMVQGKTGEFDWNHFTYTFYKCASQKGYVTLRWLGESNGYYSEEVEFGKIIKVESSPPNGPTGDTCCLEWEDRSYKSFLHLQFVISLPGWVCNYKFPLRYDVNIHLQNCTEADAYLRAKINYLKYEFFEKESGAVLGYTHRREEFLTCLGACDWKVFEVGKDAKGF